MKRVVFAVVADPSHPNTKNLLIYNDLKSPDLIVTVISTD
jgi:hypothetical protein